MTVPDALSRAVDMIQVESETKTGDKWYNKMYYLAGQGLVVQNLFIFILNRFSEKVFK